MSSITMSGNGKKREIENEQTTSSRRVSSRSNMQPSQSEDVDRVSRRRSAEESLAMPRIGSSNDRSQDAPSDNEESDTKKYNIQKFKFGAKAREQDKFNGIPSEAQSQCIKAIARLFIFKGGKKESIRKDLVIETLGKIDPEYRKHANIVLAKVQQYLTKHFGYTLLSGDALIGLHNAGKKEEFFIANDCGGSERLSKILRVNQGNESFFGFMGVVFFAIFTSSGKKCSVEDLLIAVRKADPRFPNRLPTNRDKDNLTSVPVAELGDDFLGLLGRMKKEGYIVQSKDVAEGGGGNDPGKVLYCLGPRYFLEIGNRDLVVKYYQQMGQPVDMAIVREIEEENRKELAAAAAEAAEAEGGAGGGEGAALQEAAGASNGAAVTANAAKKRK